jgi:hypothetical protein
MVMAGRPRRKEKSKLFEQFLLEGLAGVRVDSEAFPPPGGDPPTRSTTTTFVVTAW